MKQLIQKFVKDERGVTALETAIILIAFVVVAAVFAFTILSTGTFMTERSKEAAYSGLAQVRGSMELKGSVLANATVNADPTLSAVNTIVFTVANVSGGQPLDFTPPGGGSITNCGVAYTVDANFEGDGTNDFNVVNISFRDAKHNIPIKYLHTFVKATNTAADVYWSVCKIGSSNANNMLEDRELFQVTVNIAGALADYGAGADILGHNTPFAIEIKPPQGAVLDIQRTTPPYLALVNDLK